MALAAAISFIMISRGRCSVYREVSVSLCCLPSLVNPENIANVSMANLSLQNVNGDIGAATYTIDLVAL